MTATGSPLSIEAIGGNRDPVQRSFLSRRIFRTENARTLIRYDNPPTEIKLVRHHQRYDCCANQDYPGEAVKSHIPRYYGTARRSALCLPIWDRQGPVLSRVLPVAAQFPIIDFLPGSPKTRPRDRSNF
jgi:hypothetical protein